MHSTSNTCNRRKAAGAKDATKESCHRKFAAEVLLQGCVIGAGIIAVNMTGMEGTGASGRRSCERSLHGMAPNDPILQTWRDGVGLLKAASGNVSWANFAASHGNDTSFNLCPHGNWYFLPWHRAYLLSYERAVRQLTGNNDFALPYWDWTADRQLPQAFIEPTFNGQPNPLFEPATRDTRRPGFTARQHGRSWHHQSDPDADAVRDIRHQPSGRAK